MVGLASGGWSWVYIEFARFAGNSLQGRNSGKLRNFKALAGLIAARAF
jgi:hypothetical protein